MDLTLLGNQGTKYSFDYAPEVLESVDNIHPNRDYFVKFNCPEFTSLMSNYRSTGFCDDVYFLYS